MPKLPKLKRIRQWNGNSLLNLSQFHHLSAAFRMGPSNTRAESTATVTVPGRTDGATIERQSCTTASSRNPFPAGVSAAPPPNCHRRHTSDISSISATVADRPTTELAGYGNRRDNYGLYALKCDRSTAKRGILLHLPRKITQVVAGGGGTHDTHVATNTDSGPMVHEKYSPCKRMPPPDEPKIKAPPRRRKRAPAKLNSGWTPEEMPNAAMQGGLQKNSSALFRIVERESTNAAALRSGGGLGVQRIRLTTGTAMPFQNETAALSRQLKAHSADNLLAVGQPQETDVNALHCKRHSRFPSTSNLPRPQQSNASASDQTQPTPAVLHFRLQRATDFSIENNSEEIEVRFRRNPDPFETCTETVKDFVERNQREERLSLPSRAQPHFRPKSVSGSSYGVTTINTEKGPFDASCLLGDGVRDGVRNNKDMPSFVPLAAVLKQSLDSNELQRPTPKEGLLCDSSSRRCAVADTARSQNNLTTRARPPVPANSSDGSLDIFRRPACDFQEFDTIFQCSGDTVMTETTSDSTGMCSNAAVKQSNCESAAPESHTQLQQLRFSSSSFSCGSTDNMDPSAAATTTAPLAALPSSVPPGGKFTENLSPNESFRSTVQIQDYSSKHQLQRVRYLSSPSPSRATLHSSEHLRPSAGNQQQQACTTVIDSGLTASAKLSGDGVLVAEHHVNKHQQEDDEWASNDNDDDDGGDTAGNERRKVNNNLVLPLSVIDVGSSTCQRAYPVDSVFPTYRCATVVNHGKPGIDQQHHAPVETRPETNQHIFPQQNYGPASEAAVAAAAATASVTATPLSCHHRHHYHHYHNPYNRNNTTVSTTITTTSVVTTKPTVNTKPNDLRPAATTASFGGSLIPSYDEYYSGDGIVII